MRLCCSSGFGDEPVLLLRVALAFIAPLLFASPKYLAMKRGPGGTLSVKLRAAERDILDKIASAPSPYMLRRLLHQRAFILLRPETGLPVARTDPNSGHRQA